MISDELFARAIRESAYGRTRRRTAHSAAQMGALITALLLAGALLL